MQLLFVDFISSLPVLQDPEWETNIHSIVVVENGMNGNFFIIVLIFNKSFLECFDDGLGSDCRNAM
jgi:hypothetical protein